MKGFEKDVEMSEFVENLSPIDLSGFENMSSSIKQVFPTIDFYKAPYGSGRPSLSIGKKGQLQRKALSRWFTIIPATEEHESFIYLVVTERTKVLSDSKKGIALKELASLLKISAKQPEAQYRELRKKSRFKLVDIAKSPDKFISFLKKIKSIDYITKRMDGDGLLPDDYLVDADSDVLTKHEKIPEGNKKPLKISMTIEVIERDEEVKKWVLKHSNGICGCCNKNAPFDKKGNEPYLEVHHIIPLAEEGPDTVENAVALCPNCHREIHHGVNGKHKTKLIKENRNN